MRFPMERGTGDGPAETALTYRPLQRSLTSVFVHSHARRYHTVSSDDPTRTTRLLESHRVPHQGLGEHLESTLVDRQFGSASSAVCLVLLISRGVAKQHEITPVPALSLYHPHA